MGLRIADYFISNCKNLHVFLATRNKKKIPSSIADNCIIHECDIFDYKDSLKATYNINSVIHLAGPDAIFSSQNPEVSYKISTDGLSNLINACEQNDVSKFILFSSVHVYGSPLEGNLSEETATKPKSQYAINKEASEHTLAKIKSKLNFLVLRLSNGVGYPITQDRNILKLAPNDFVFQALSKGKITINSSPHILRDYIPLNDVCWVTNRLLENNNAFTNNHYNLSSGASISLIDLAKMITQQIKDLYNKNVEIEYPKSDYKIMPNKLYVDNEKIKNLIEFESSSLSEELKK